MHTEFVSFTVYGLSPGTGGCSVGVGGGRVVGGTGGTVVGGGGGTVVGSIVVVALLATSSSAHVEHITAKICY